MPRQPRLILSQSYYHVMARGNNRQLTFRDGDDFTYYLSLVRRFKRDHPFSLYHYCLMPNHIHFLVRTKEASDFSTFMKKLNLSYFHYYSKRYALVGHLWQGRYKNQPVGKDEYFVQCGKYIEQNPVRAGLVIDPAQYEYSSYRFYALDEPNELLTEDPFYRYLGYDEAERQEKYQKMLIHDEIVGSYKKKIWGSPDQRYNEQKKLSYHLSKEL